MTAIRVLGAGLCLAGLACSPPSPTAEPFELPSLPPSNSLDPGVGEQFAERYAAARRVLADQAPPARAAAALGELAKVYHAYGYMTEAESCYRQARALDAGEFRWAYYLGSVARGQGLFGDAKLSFEDALELRPHDVPGLIQLAETNFDLREFKAAEATFRRALEHGPSARARFGLGRIALERGDFALAVDELRQALALQPNVSALHYSLALGYRGLGDERAAEHFGRVADSDHLRQTRLHMQDPLMEAVSAIRGGAMIHEHRGLRAVARSDFGAAALAFEQALALDPDRRDARHNFALALLRLGRRGEALEQIERLLEQTPQDASALVLLATVRMSDGALAEAAGHLRTAIGNDPRYAPAHGRLGEALLQMGEPEKARSHFDRARHLDPTLDGAYIGLVASLVETGDFAAATAATTEGLEARPDNSVLELLLARLLAAAPDPQVRDGARAIELAGPGEPTSPGQAETLAMAHAELGRFDDASFWQSRAVDAASDPAARRIATRRLARYRSRLPCRTPLEPGERISLASLDGAPSKASP